MALLRLFNLKILPTTVLFFFQPNLEKDAGQTKSGAKDLAPKFLRELASDGRA
jgi:hypothetical protein